MAAVHDPERVFGKDVISTYSDNPAEAARAAMLYNYYTQEASSIITSRVVHMECDRFLSHHFSLDVHNPDGLNVDEAIAHAQLQYPVCPKCGKPWKNLKISQTR